MTDLTGVSYEQLRLEIERRDCAADQHQPTAWIHAEDGTIVSAYCLCGEATYKVKRVTMKRPQPSSDRAARPSPPTEWQEIVRWPYTAD